MMQPPQGQDQAQGQVQGQGQAEAQAQGHVQGQEEAPGVPANQLYMKQASYDNLPPPPPPPPPGHGQWTTGIFDCFEDIPITCITLFCPCITFGRIAEIVDKGATSCGTAGAIYALILAVTGPPGYQFIYSCSYRTRMKMQYGMESDALADCCVHCWCEQCALCQEYRELQNRGFEPALGWHGNLERQNQGIGTTIIPPFAPGQMLR